MDDRKSNSSSIYGWPEVRLEHSGKRKGTVRKGRKVTGKGGDYVSLHED